MRSILFALMGFISLSASAQTMGLTELFSNLESKSSEFQLQRLEAEAIRRQGQSRYGKVLPEIGVEGGARTSREREKRNDLFYYGYARYDLSLGQIAQMRAAIHQSRLGKIASAQVLIQTRLAVAAAYYRAFSLQENIHIKANDLLLVEKQLQAARRRVDSGIAIESDVLEFKMHEQELENDLRLSKIDFDLALRDLERMTGVELGSIQALREEIPPISPVPSFDVAWKKSLENNLSIKRAKAEAAILKAEKFSALSDSMPRLSVEGQYGKLMETDFFESKKNSWDVVGKVTLPLFNGGSAYRSYQEKAAMSERAELSASLEELRMKSYLKAMIDKVQALNDKLKGEEQNLKYAEKYFDLVMSEYRRGVKNSPDVASATDKLFEAKWRRIETLINLSMSDLELKSIQGEL